MCLIMIRDSRANCQQKKERKKPLAPLAAEEEERAAFHVDKLTEFESNTGQKDDTKPKPIAGNTPVQDGWIWGRVVRSGNEVRRNVISCSFRMRGQNRAREVARKSRKCDHRENCTRKRETGQGGFLC